MCVFYPKCQSGNWHLSCNAAYLREGIQGLPDWEQRSGERGVCSGGRRGGETSLWTSLTQGFGSRARKTSGHITGELSQWDFVQLRGSQAQSQPAQHPSAGVGPQVSLYSGLLLTLAAISSSSLPPHFLLTLPFSLFKKESCKGYLQYAPTKVVSQFLRLCHCLRLVGSLLGSTNVTALHILFVIYI